MPTNGADTTSIPSIALGKENDAPDWSRRLSRSPHPYHRDKIFLSSLTPINGVALGKDGILRDEPGLESSSGNKFSGTTYFDSDSQKRRKSITSPSNSGTEADDESGGFLRGLPAPPVKQRKGLKAPSASSSPLLTPSYLDDENRRLNVERQLRRRKSVQSPTLTDEETKKIAEKFTRRRRAELLRRITETLLLGSVTCITCNSASKILLRRWTKELIAHGFVVSLIYFSYPLRLFCYHRAYATHEKKIYSGIRVPAAFDPAPLLYPVLIPILVAMLLAPVDPRVILLNVVLSISSIPHQTIPFSESPPRYSSIQWLLSTLPLALPHERNSSPAQTTYEFEDIMLLHPLHQALVTFLGYLTTTSLLPAELQLLSVSMINLLFLATSPQAVILKAFLWIGGLSIFLFCGTVLKWEVALARVPSWRFRHPRRRARRGYVLFSALDDYFKGRLHNWGLVSGPEEATDSDEPRNFAAHARRNMRQDKLKVASGKTEIATSYLLPKTPLSAIDLNGSPPSFRAKGTSVPFQTQFNSHRKNTLSSHIGDNSGHCSMKTRTGSRKTKISLAKPRSFLSLTEAQATVVKWCNAIYVYSAVVAIVIAGIRIYVSQSALYGREPVGWALGYMFGDLPLFGTTVASLGLDDWIPLPAPFVSYQRLRGSSMACHVQQMCFGAANVRLLLCAYYLGIIIAGLAVVFRLSASVEVDTRRKVFHGMMVAMFLPTVFIDPAFTAFALILVLAVFLLFDLFRASQLPPVSKPLTHFLAPYVDGRDHRGPVIVSHIFLLIGCAIPLWLSLAAIERTGEPPWEGWDVSKRELSMVSGVICVGMGDAAASLIGRRYGRRRWYWSGGKSLEGSLAFAIAVILGLGVARIWLQIGGWAGDSGDAWALTFGKAAVAATCASLTEAVLTGGNDNVIVPIILWLVVRGLKM